MRMVLRALLVLLVVVAGGFLILGFWTGTRAGNARPGSPAPIGTSGKIDISAARERGAEVGEKAAAAAAKVTETVSEAAVTAKIKAKMALDDSVKSRAIDVSTDGSTVTLSGTVRSKAEHERAVALARETDGVTRVVDHLEVVSNRITN